MSNLIKLNFIRHQVVIAGQVSDNVTGETIANAIVEITAMPDAFQKKRSLQALQYGSKWEILTKRCDRTTTAIDGFFYFLDLPSGQYTLTASLPSAATPYKIATITVTVPPPPNDNPSQPKFAVANLALFPCVIQGTVTELQDEDKKVPIAKANIKILGSGESTVTDNDGKFKLIGLEAPNQEGSKRIVKVVVSAKGYQEKTETFQLGLGEVVEKDIKLTKQNGTRMTQPSSVLNSS